MSKEENVIHKCSLCERQLEEEIYCVIIKVFIKQKVDRFQSRCVCKHCADTIIPGIRKSGITNEDLKMLDDLLDSEE